MALDDYSGASGNVCSHMIRLLFNLEIVEDIVILSLYGHVGSHSFLIILKFDMLANSIIHSFLQMYYSDSRRVDSFSHLRRCL